MKTNELTLYRKQSFFEAESNSSQEEFRQFRKRAKSVFIGQEDLLAILSKNAYLEGFPEDYEVVNVGFDPMRQGFIIVICSLEFPEVILGAHLEELSPTRIEIISPEDWKVK